MSTRSTLKGYFKTGAIPTEIQFADFIDSALNFDDDAIIKFPGGPLSVKASGTDESLLNFYRVEQDGNKLSWQLKQKPDGKPGLSIGGADGASRLYIDGAAGNIGVGTTAPTAKLHVAGDATLDGSLKVGGASIELAANVKFNSLGRMHISGDEGLYLLNKSGVVIGKEWGGNGNLTVEGNLSVAGSIAGAINGDVICGNEVNGSRFIVHTRPATVGDFLQITADDTNGNWDWSKGIVFMRATGDVGIGTTNPTAKLHVAGDVTLDGSLKVGGASIELAANVKFNSLGRMHISGDEGLYLLNKSGVVIGKEWGGNGNLTVEGDVSLAGTIYSGGNPLAYENFEIHLKGSASESIEGDAPSLSIANISLGISDGRGLNTIVLNPRGVLKNRGAHDVYADPAAWNVWAEWVNANAASGDIVAVASRDAVQNAPRGGLAEALLMAVGAREAFSAIKGNVRSPYALIFIKGGTALEVSRNYKEENAHIKTSYYNLLAPPRTERVILESRLRQRMYPDDPKVYQEIFDAKNAGAIAKLGNPGYDETSFISNLWNDRHLIRFGGTNEADGNGAVVTIPAGYNTVWVRVLGERWSAIKAYFLDGAQEQLGIWTGGFRSVNCYCPDGSLTDSYKDAHQWLPIPAGRAGRLALIAKPNTTNDFWLSGLAFSRNPWAHATLSAVGYHWASNGGNPTTWSDGWENWNSDNLTKIEPKTNLELKVPVLPSGRDKLLYLVEHNNNWNGAMHNGITVNGTPIERFMASYDNPFSRHFCSKFYNRYIAARIPAAVVGNARSLSVRVDMSKQNEGIYFREIGTHDLETPWG